MQTRSPRTTQLANREILQVTDEGAVSLNDLPNYDPPQNRCLIPSGNGGVRVNVGMTPTDNFMEVSASGGVQLILAEVAASYLKISSAVTDVLLISSASTDKLKLSST